MGAEAPAQYTAVCGCHLSSAKVLTFKRVRLKTLLKGVIVGSAVPELLAIAHRAPTCTHKTAHQEGVAQPGPCSPSNLIEIEL